MPRDHPPVPPSVTGPSAWATFADLLIQRAALVARVDRNRSPDALAGLKVDDEDVERILGELPGLEPGDAVAAAEIEAAAAEAVAAARGELLASVADGEDGFSLLVRQAGLADTEVEVLAVLCAVEVDPRRQRLVGYLNDDVTVRRLTPWTLAQLWGTGSAPLRAVGPGGGLQRAALLARPVAGPWGSAALAVAGTVLWWLAGDRFLDPDLPAGASVVAGPPGPAAGGDAKRDRIRARLALAAGPDRLRRLQAAVAGLDAGACLVTPVPQSAEQWDAVIRQATVADLGVVVEAGDDLPPEGRDRIGRADHLAWAVTSVNDLPLASLPERTWVELAVAPAPATPAEWVATFPDLEAQPFPLTADQLRHVSRASEAMGGDLRGAVRRLAAGHIDATATRLRPERSWDDLVLDEERMIQVREISIRARHRATVFGQWGFAPQPSTGVVALFAGPSGTGKTLAAEIIAGDLGVDLYKVDLANLVSKYIGETEKNLSKVFEAAEASRVALFFDEADALLGRRSEVSDAHDRYANIEVAYLLQRLERYEGVAVLATNLVKNIDPAFMRRIHVLVEFPMPEAPERRRIWARSLPPGAPVSADLDLDALADRVEVSGGTIRNAALSAAFLAAEAGTPITMDLAVTALRREMQKMGRLVSATDIGSLGSGRRPD